MISIRRRISSKDDETRKFFNVNLIGSYCTLFQGTFRETGLSMVVSDFDRLGMRIAVQRPRRECFWKLSFSMVIYKFGMLARIVCA